MQRAFLFWWLLATLVAAEELRLVQFTDVHASGPYYSASAFEQASREGLAQNPHGVLLTGDHGDNSSRPESFAQRFAQAVELWREPLSHYRGEVFFALGNDDFGNNYQSYPEDLRETYYTCLDTFGQRYYLDELGNGEAPSRLGGFRWLTINSQLFSPWNQTPQAPDQAKATLRWLGARLQSEAGAAPVMLLSHIAPTWDLYFRKPAWKDEYLVELRHILQAYPGQVMIFSGHNHRNHLQAMRPERPIAIMTAGALATKYGYQPNWREISCQPGSSEISYTLHYPGHPEWTSSYQFQPALVANFLTQLLGNSNFYTRYARDVFGNHKDADRWAQDPKIRQAILDEFWVKTR